MHGASVAPDAVSGGQQSGQLQLILSPPPGAHRWKRPVQAKGPTQSQWTKLLHSWGIGSQVGSRSTCEINCTHMVPSGQSLHSGTTSQLSAGTQRPVQQAPFSVTPGTCPWGQSGVGASQTTSRGSQRTRSVVQTPKRHTAWSMPSASQVG